MSCWKRQRQHNGKHNTAHVAPPRTTARVSVGCICGWGSCLLSVYAVGKALLRNGARNGRTFHRRRSEHIVSRIALYSSEWEQYFSTGELRGNETKAAEKVEKVASS